MRSFWLVMVLVAACDSGAPTCKDAVTKARSADEGMTFDAAARLVGKCELGDWTVATRKCIAAAKNRHDLEACTEKLTPQDQEQLQVALAAMTRFKDEFCQCTTSTCAQRVSDEMTKWGQEQAKTEHEPPKMTEEQTKLFTELGEQMGRCMQKAMSVPDGAIQPPPPIPAPAPARAAPPPANDVPF
jgi:hypothetical protein